jgi:molybdopterin-guanine dinucleotide biosynthesis protein A
MTITPMTGFILAGGRSSRMGRDKALLDWHGGTLLDYMVCLLRHATDDIHVVGRNHLPDHIPGLGPLSGIATALTITSTDHNLILAVDLPLLTKKFLTYFRRAIEHSKHPVLACKIRSHFPLCLGIRRGLLPEVQQRLKSVDLSVRAFIEGSDAEIISEFELREQGFESSIFHNLNTPEDYLSMLG